MCGEGVYSVEACAALVGFCACEVAKTIVFCFRGTVGGMIKGCKDLEISTCMAIGNAGRLE